ncbi:hypothetical protein [Couchioplanes caeruleus]|uniref:Uncharacterized protein n=2 Tax=Couchioplanes caeruleus TaxID=56438 RepID=A0A1K0FNW4_9ACTN|nr:hypothetical protein [Couchioplanes caeruleus]OJF14481.1 hypothetical protein BG844_09590 [Couchioplanes caeruleus subsp. caeruleus]ROP21265.1 hypothetical protein EDD30_7661 [Couchioplanes caeruleus]
MSAQLIVRVHLDWTAPGHYEPKQARPCRLGDGPTRMRDASGRPCHQECAEDEIARELYGRGQALIADERVPSPAARARGGAR